MKLLGFELTLKRAPAILQSVDSSRGWFPLVVREPFTGAWQRNEELKPQSALAYAPVFACVTLIANDIGKLRMRLIQSAGNDIWTPAENSAYSPVLRRPNHFQTSIEFYKSWMFSRLLNGNTYVLKQRNGAQKVEAKYVLDPTRVEVLVAPNGDVYYRLKLDHLSHQHGDLYGDDVIVPATEIIHDKQDAIFHPLCGLTPLSACFLTTLQALKIQSNQSDFFANGSNPSGILTAPGHIPEDKAKALKERWEANYGGRNAGRIAVVGDGLKFEAMRMTAVDSQLVEQLKLTAEDICTAFHVPPYKIGVGPYPPYNNIEALNTEYYSQALQSPIESIEALEDHGMSLPLDIGVEFDLDQLLRMDTQSRTAAASQGIGAAVFSPNEARKRFFGLPPVKGGESPYLQQQNFSLGALRERDQDDPFAKPATPPPATSVRQEPDDAADDDAPAAEKAFSMSVLEAAVSRGLLPVITKHVDTEVLHG